MRRLENKVALISGAGSGIGAASAKRFAAEGAKVMIYGRRSEPLQAVVAAIREQGGEADWMQADATEEQAVAAAVASTIERFGRLDIMVNNAVSYNWGMLEQISLKDWHDCLRGGLDVAFLGTRAALQQMKQNGGGSIVNLGSVVGMLGSPGLSAYGAAKAAVVNFTRAAALEGAPHNVRVNVVVPGVVWTEATQAALTTEAMVQGTARAVPLGRIAKAEEVANAILFLASDESSYITGHSLVVDGGKTCELNVGATDYDAWPSG